MKKALFSLTLVLFIILGAFLCVYYAKTYAGNTAYKMQLALSVICAAEAVMTSTALYLRVTNSNFKYKKTVNAIAFILCLQVGLFAFMWFTYFLGIAVDSIS